MFQALAHLEKLRRSAVNARSLTAALGWSSLQNSLGGKKSKPVHFSAFMPYQDEYEERDRELSRWATAIAVKLVRQKVLPVELDGYLRRLKEVAKEL